MTMKQGVRSEVDRVDVQGLQDGVQLEASDAPPPGDSVRTGADSLTRRQAGR
jgi:hypothetical protein